MQLHAVYKIIITIVPSLIPRPEGGERAWFQPFVHVLNRGGIPPPLHTIGILPYTHDARIDTKRNTVCRFMVTKYGMEETHSIVLIQQPI